VSDQTGSSGVPKFKSTPPPSLPFFHPQNHPLPPISPISPSYFNIPHGLSLAELLDSPVLLHSSNVSQPSSHSFVLWFLTQYVLQQRVVQINGK